MCIDTTYYTVYCVKCILEYLGVPDCKGFGNVDVQRNEMDHSTLLTPLVSLLFWTFLNPLQIFMKFLNSLYNMDSTVVARFFIL